VEVNLTKLWSFAPELDVRFISTLVAVGETECGKPPAWRTRGTRGTLGELLSS